MKMDIKIVLLLLISKIQCINIISCKVNMLVGNNSHYEYGIKMLKSDANLISSALSLSFTLNNSVPTNNQYFDFFPYLDKDDKQCYQQAISNSSYLFPCSFLLNQNTQLRLSSVKNIKEFTNIPVQILNDLHYHFVIDNTPYPFPTGACPYSHISVNFCNELNVSLSDSYQYLGIRLAYINVTVILIYLVVILILYCKNRRIVKKLQESDNNLHESFVNPTNEQQSDKDNYEQIVNNEFEIQTHTNKEKPQSIISSKQSAYKMQ